MELSEVLLESWDRQCRILMSVADLVDEENRGAKPSSDGWALDHQLAHVHHVRQEWLSNVDPARAGTLGKAFKSGWSDPIDSLDEIRAQLRASEAAIRAAMAEFLANGTEKVGGYDHPVFFLQHMIWHEGWHVGLISLALRLAGKEPSDEWEEANVWGHWRRDEW